MNYDFKISISLFQCAFYLTPVNSFNRKVWFASAFSPYSLTEIHQIKRICQFLKTNVSHQHYWQEIESSNFEKVKSVTQSAPENLKNNNQTKYNYLWKRIKEILFSKK